MPTFPSLPAALAERAASTPEEPWLFYRRDYDWSWRSWSQVAYQVAGGAESLRRSGQVAEQGAAVAVPVGREADTVAAALAVLAAGGHPVLEGEAVETASGWTVPPVPSRLERWTPDLEALRLESPEPAGDPWRAAKAWQACLPSVEPGPGERPVALASGSVERSSWQVLLAWTLVTGAAWALEEDPDLFVPAVLRNRPTFVLATGAEAGLLALALQAKRHRKWHRLRAVGLVDDAPAEVFLEEGWQALSVPVVRLNRPRRQRVHS